MYSGKKIGKSLTFQFIASALLAALVSAPAFAAPRASAGMQQPQNVLGPTALSQSRRFGPFATVDRANQVANYFRRMGYNASIHYAGSYLAGTREYYVDVW